MSSAAAATRLAPEIAVQRPDLMLLGVASILLLIGYIAISSASVEYAVTFADGDSLYFSNRHFVYISLAVTFAAGVFVVPVTFWLNTGWVWLFLGLALLLLVVIPGTGPRVNGSRRWLGFAGFTLQASEFAKLSLIVYLAGYLQRRETEVRGEWQGFVKPMAVIFAMTLLLLMEPDFGATVVIVGTAFGMMFLAGARLSHFMVVACASAAALAVLVMRAPYRMQRLTSYTDPWQDQFDTGYQLVQSLIAFGRGEWFGVGLGNSVQKLFYLPEAHTDFVFSIWAEEMGLIGALLVVMLYLALIYRIFWIAHNSSVAGDRFGAHICHGVGLVFAAQAFINIGVSSGLLPTKGLTLPLLSYGGSSLIACCCMLALVLRIDLECRSGRPKRGR